MSQVEDLHPQGLDSCVECRGMGALACTPAIRSVIAAARRAHVVLMEAPVNHTKGSWDTDRRRVQDLLQEALIAYDRRSPR